MFRCRSLAHLCFGNACRIDSQECLGRGLSVYLIKPTYADSWLGLSKGIMRRYVLLLTSIFSKNWTREMEMPKAALNLQRRQGRIRNLWVGRGISQISDWIAAYWMLTIIPSTLVEASGSDGQYLRNRPQ